MSAAASSSTASAARQALLLSNALKTTKPGINKDLSVQYKKYLLKNMLINFNKHKEQKSQLNPFLSEIKSQFFNKGNNLQSLHDLNSNIHQIFKFNKNLEINTVMLDRRVSKLIKQFLTISLPSASDKLSSSNQTNMKTVLPLYMSEPVFKHGSSQIEISFYYYQNFPEDTKRNRFYNKNAKYYIPIVNKLFSSLTSNSSSSSLAFHLQQYYNKKVIIKPTKLKYIFTNNDIFAQYLTNTLKKQPNLARRLDRFITQFVPKIDDESIAIKYNLGLIEKTDEKLNKVISKSQNSFNDKIDVTKLYSSDKSSVAKNLLMFKYLAGLQIKTGGRGNVSTPSGRAEKKKVNLGTFRNKVYTFNILSNRYKLNLLKANIHVNQSQYFGKFGSYGVSVKANYV